MTLAARAAVDATGGGGRTAAVEREDEPRVAWEIEVIQPDGTQVEVHLNQNLERVAIDRDDDGAQDDRADDDDAGDARDRSADD